MLLKLPGSRLSHVSNYSQGMENSLVKTVQIHLNCKYACPMQIRIRDETGRQTTQVVSLSLSLSHMHVSQTVTRS